MKHIVSLVILSILAVFVVCTVPIARADSTAGGSGSAIAPASGSAVVAPPPTSSQLHDPSVDPLAAYNDVRGLTARWPLLVLAVGIMLAKLVHYAGDKLGAVGTWLAVGHRAMIVAAGAGVLAALYDSIASGGTWASALLAAGLAAVALIKPTAPAQSTNTAVA